MTKLSKTPSFIHRLRTKGWQIGEIEWLAHSHTATPDQYRLVKAPKMDMTLHLEERWIRRAGEKGLLRYERESVGAAYAKEYREHVFDQLKRALMRNPNLKTLTVKLDVA